MRRLTSPIRSPVRGCRFAGVLTMAILTLFAVSQCTVEKRRFLKGYHVQWHKSRGTVPASVAAAQKPRPAPAVKTVQTASGTKQGVHPTLVADAGNSIVMPQQRARRNLLIPADSCSDRIVFRNGEEWSVKIIEFSDDHVKYRRCDNREGPEYFTSSENVFSIQFAGGLKRLFKLKEPAPEEKPALVEKKANGMAIASFVTVFFFFLLVPLLLSFIFGVVALKQINKEPARFKGRWMAVVGVVAGSIALLLLLLLVAAIFI